MPSILAEDLPMIPMLQGFGPTGIQAGLARIGDIARTRLVTLAQQELKTSQRDYIAGISNPVLFVDNKGVPGVEITLRGALPNMLENGAEPFDLRVTLLNPGKEKRPGTRGIVRSKQGYLYRSIPFRRMGQGASGKNAPRIGGAETSEGQRETSRAFRGQMTAEQARTQGRAVVRAAKKLAPTVGLPGEKVQYGGSLPAGTAGSQKLRPRHATDLNAGMLREQKTYESATQDQFITFRTISNNPNTVRSDDAQPSGPAQNWMHPGLTRRLLIPKTETYIDMLISRRWIAEL